MAAKTCLYRDKTTNKPVVLTYPGKNGWYGMPYDTRGRMPISEREVGPFPTRNEVLNELGYDPARRTTG